MNCTEFESSVLEIARESLSDARRHAEAQAHTQTCPRCARRLAAERVLTAAFGRVIAEDSRLSAPPVVEKILLGALRERKSVRSERRRAWLTRGLVGAAAILLVVVLATWQRPQTRPATGVSSKMPATAPVRVTAPVYREEEKPPVRVLHARTRKPARPASHEAPRRAEFMTDFIPVVYDPTPIQRGQVVRVRLPHAALLAFGLPVNEQHAEESIQADVLLGDDGLARAVRFVK
ncbi:MAG TPA: hypothetical protein VJN43_14955 [Bryobacteraceae bacterium]|nr:hypothetical protein [Bryobacteraceae bacterium]